MYIEGTCKVHLQLDYKCALHDYSNVHQMYIIMQVCYVLCKVHIQGTFQVVFKVHLRYKKMWITNASANVHFKVHVYYISMYINNVPYQCA